jgi:intracellular sulfur oxidation DsrE/DsrF family protein
VAAAGAIRQTPGLAADPELESLMQRSHRISHRIAAMTLAVSAGNALAEGPAAQPAVVAAPPAIAAAPAETHKERAIFAVSDADPQKWNLTLGNISNAIEGLGAGSADIELVVYGPGIAMLKKDSAVAARLAEAIKAGVRVAACQNSMRGFHLEATDLVPGTTPVPSGVVELIRREHSGYAYVRS